MSDPASRERVLDLLAEAATHELEFIRFGRLARSAESQWTMERDLYAAAAQAAPDQQERIGAESAFINSCFVFAELLEQIAPRYEQAFDLAATHYEHALREQRELNASGVGEIRTLVSSFQTLPADLLDAAERATRSADTAYTLAVTAALYPPNPSLESALLRIESLQRQMIGTYRAVRERYRELVERIG